MWHTWEITEKCTGFWWKRPRKREKLEDQGIDGRMGSECILGRWAGGGLDLVDSRQGPVASSCERGDETMGSGATEFVS
jgi:hypothetical protein